MRRAIISGLGAALSIYTLIEVNYPLLTPHSQLAVFAMFGLGLCYLHFPIHPKLRDNVLLSGLDWVLAALTMPAVLAPGGSFDPWSVLVPAAIIGGVAARATKSIGAAILVGLPALWLLRALVLA